MPDKTQTTYTLYLDAFAFIASFGAQGASVQPAEPSEEALAVIALGVADGLQARAVAGRAVLGASADDMPPRYLRTKADVEREVGRRLGTTPAS